MTDQAPPPTLPSSGPPGGTIDSAVMAEAYSVSDLVDELSSSDSQEEFQDCDDKTVANCVINNDSPESVNTSDGKVKKRAISPTRDSSDNAVSTLENDDDASEIPQQNIIPEAEELYSTAQRLNINELREKKPIDGQ